jgi:hypothetical protein
MYWVNSRERRNKQLPSFFASSENHALVFADLLTRSSITTGSLAVSPECSINRYYDPTTDEFLSIDPKVAQTDEPYVFTSDDPLNATDPLGLKKKGAVVLVSNINIGKLPPNGSVSDMPSILPKGSTPSQALRILWESGVKVPSNYVAVRASNGKGWVFRPQGNDPSEGPTIRAMEEGSNPNYPDSDFRITNSGGQALNAQGKPGSQEDTHFQYGSNEGSQAAQSAGVGNDYFSDDPTDVFVDPFE